MFAWLMRLIWWLLSFFRRRKPVDSSAPGLAQEAVISGRVIRIRGIRLPVSVSRPRAGLGVTAPLSQSRSRRRTSR